MASTTEDIQRGIKEVIDSFFDELKNELRQQQIEDDPEHTNIAELGQIIHDFLSDQKILELRTNLERFTENVFVETTSDLTNPATLSTPDNSIKILIATIQHQKYAIYIVTNFYGLALKSQKHINLQEIEQKINALIQQKQQPAISAEQTAMRDLIPTKIHGEWRNLYKANRLAEMMQQIVELEEQYAQFGLKIEVTETTISASDNLEENFSSFRGQKIIEQHELELYGQESSELVTADHHGRQVQIGIPQHIAPAFARVKVTVNKFGIAGYQIFDESGNEDKSADPEDYQRKKPSRSPSP